MPAFQNSVTPLLVAATIDCRDPEGLAAWWAELLGVVVTHSDGQFAFLGYAPDRKTTIWFQKVPEEKTGKNRVHLDFAVPDLDATCERIATSGGTVGEAHSWGGFHWRTCRDPEGNEFDVMQAPEVEESD
jgi:predicted enzyme related to lactoylglutathione lyase